MFESFRPKNALKGTLLKAVTAIIFFAISLSSFSQQDPGGNPDGPPPALPMDDYMHLIFAAAGALFAMGVLRRFHRAKAI